MDKESLVRRASKQYQSPNILEPLDCSSSINIDDLTMDSNLIVNDLKSLDINSDGENSNSDSPCFLLLDEHEKFKISNVNMFIKKLKIPNADIKVKVVSIFGNTGEGKSYTLNHAFFNGQTVFRTSAEQTSCTFGVWAAYDPHLKIIVLDTEGLLGFTRNESKRERMLMKVLAISDIVIYKTRSERLHQDMFMFLGGASKSYKQHFRQAVHHAWTKLEVEPPPESFGPSVIVFHETLHTNTLQASAGVIESPEDIIRQRFDELKLECDSFSSIKYIGIRTKDIGSSFYELKTAVQLELENYSVRAKRLPKVIYQTIKTLNEKFSHEITPHQLSLKDYLTCPVKCQSCNEGCNLSMSHKEEGEMHKTNAKCKFQQQYQNFVYLCKRCNSNGHRVVAYINTVPRESWTSVFNYVWSGYEIVCQNCGVIYKSREHWFGNKNPEDLAVIIETVHMWPGERNYLSAQNSAQRVLDGVNMISDVVSSVTAPPTRALSDWVTDKIAPSYWRPNHEITYCHRCKTQFAMNATKHHCRECGEGFCEKCSSKSRPVPSRGWMYDVRVCDGCYEKDIPSPIRNANNDDTDVRVRKYGEVFVNSISAVAAVAIDIPRDFIKDSARPSYWVPDAECLNCSACDNPFGTLIPLHHCRECGKGVCDDCSGHKKPVPLRGWDNPVRVCDNCLKK